MGKLFSVDTARQLVLFGIVGIGLGCLLALIVPLFAADGWSWSAVVDALPYAIAASLMLMTVAAVADSKIVLLGRDVIPWLIAGAGLLAGGGLFLQAPLTQFLRPWIARRDLPSIVLGVLGAVLVGAVCYSWDRQVPKFKQWMHGRLTSGVQQIIVGACGVVLVLVAHFTWADFGATFERVVTRDPNVNPLTLFASGMIPVVIVGILVGFCINRALSGPPPGPQTTFSETPSIDARHDYVWHDFAPCRPFRTVYQDRRAKITPVVAIFTAMGFVVGVLLWRDQWVGTGVTGALLGLLAAGAYSALVNWGYRNFDQGQLLEELVYRRAFVTEVDNRLRFIVVTEDGSLTGKTLIDRPWDDVVEFSRARYSEMFESAATRPFADRDWTVIVMVPASGPPQLVAESMGSLKDDYATLSELTERFDPRARSKFMQVHKRPADETAVGQAAVIPEQL